MDHTNIVVSILDILFSSNHNIHKSSCGLCFWASDALIVDCNKTFQWKGLKPKNKGHANFYECCDLMEKVYLRAAIYSDQQKPDEQGARAAAASVLT